MQQRVILGIALNRIVYIKLKGSISLSGEFSSVEQCMKYVSFTFGMFLYVFSITVSITLTIEKANV